MSGENGGKKSLYGFVVRERDERTTQNPNGRSVDIKRLWSRSHEILNLDSLGYKGTEIAKMLDIHPVTVSNTLNSTLGKDTSSDIRERRDEEYEGLREEVMELTKKSLKVYRKILDEELKTAVSMPSKLGKETADTVALELSGMRAPTRIDTRSVHMAVTASEIEEFKRRGIAAARASGKIVDIKPASQSQGD